MSKYAQSSRIRHLFFKGQPLSFSKGEIILGNDTEPNGVYFIGSGYIKVYSISDTGNEYVHIIYGHGELFPFSWAYLGIEPDGLFFEALTSCSLWRMSREWFEKSLLADVQLSYDMGVQLAQQFRMYSDRLENLEYQVAKQRVIYRLLFLASRFGVKDDTGNILIDVPLTHELIAHSINLSRETVSRQLEKLEHSKLIRQTGHQIICLDIDALVSKLGRPMSFKDWNFE
jgi:CRP-like cAMP-binding protein